MKKIILLTSVVFAIMLFSCSKDDDNTPKQLPITYKNISGKWFISQVILPDGSIKAHTGYCPTERDYVVITEFPKIRSTMYGTNCLGSNTNWCNDFFLHPITNTISSCDILFDGTIVELTDSKMKIDYGSTKTVFASTITNANGVIFSRQ
jgi:hypothetical protein